MHCKLIPPWTKVTETMGQNGEVVKHYEFSGMCGKCGRGEFEVVEVRNTLQLERKAG